MASRASWNHNYEKGLLDLLVEHNVPIYRGQNGWVAEGWRSITNKFNQKFPLAKYTKQQIQEKEKDMKANYKAVRDARKQSGTGWNDSLCMIIAEPVIWDKLKKDFPRVKKFESKPFVFFPILASLYEGNIATGDLNFLSIPQVEQTSDTTSPKDSSNNQTLNPFSASHDVGDVGQSSTSVHINLEAEPTTSATSGQKGEEPVKKRKQSQVALVLEEYMDFRKKQTQKLVEVMKEPKEAFTIANYVAALEPMEELTTAEKVKALRLFKCALNRETFLNIKDPILRVFWLKEEIADMHKN
ncbi:unnamed protein product [Alopecurus aequalis]